MTAITLPKAIENFVAATNAHDVIALEKAFAPGGDHRRRRQRVRHPNRAP